MQKYELLRYLQEHGSITGLEALTQLGIMSYTKKISQLRAAGIIIRNEWQTKRSRFGVKRFVRYVLIKAPKNAVKSIING